jgi:hypothetical protein
MLSLRAAGAVISLAVLNLQVTTCRSPGEGGKEPAPQREASASVELSGVDTSELTGREKAAWSGAVSELLAPCPDVAVSLSQCVKEQRKCDECLPAARMIADHVKRGKTRSQVEAAFRLRFAPEAVKPIEIGDSPAKGPKGAPVTIVEWADFECPFCGRAAPILDRLIAEYPGKVRLVFKNYPLSGHQHAEKAARAAVAAGKQGKFWQMHQALFANTSGALDEARIKQIAREVGLDPKQFDDELDSEPVADQVMKERRQGDKLDLAGTPMIYINGRYFDFDHFDLGEDLRPWIELEIELRTGEKVEPVSSRDDSGAETAELGPDAPSKKGDVPEPKPNSAKSQNDEP